jgi:hypothetical protein
MRRSVLAVPILSAVLSGAVGGMCVQLFIAGPSAVAQPGPEVAAGVTAQEFRLTTRDGTTRAQLLLWDGQRPMLVLGDAHCQMRVTRGLSEQGGHPTLVLYDEDCRQRAALDLVPDGLPELTFRDETDVPRARLHLLKDGSPMFRLFDPQGRTLWTAAR